MNKAKALLAAVIFILLVVGVFQHFHDDPPPDLSRFSRPAHDPAAYARVEAISNALRTHHRQYAPKEPGDPTSRDALFSLALKRDDNAVRALRRHLKSNEIALSVARELVTLKTFSFPPWDDQTWPSPLSAMLFDAHRLLLADALLAINEGRRDDAWMTLCSGIESARVRDQASGSLLASGINLVCEKRLLEMLEALCAEETEPQRLKAVLARLDKSKPDPLTLFRAAASGEMLYIADRIRVSGGGSVLHRLIHTPSAPNQTLREKAREQLNNLHLYWLWINTLPNATMANHAHIVDEEIADPSTHRPVPPPVNDPFLVLRRNAGGLEGEKCIPEEISWCRARCFDTRLRHDRLRLSLALRIYALEHEGRHPATLAELVPDLLPEVPANVLDGKPFLYDPVTGSF